MKNIRLEILRKELGLNKTDFATLLGITPNYYYNIIKGDGSSNLRLEHLENLLAKRGVNPAWVMTGEGEKFIATALNGSDTIGENVELLPDKKFLINGILAWSKIPSVPGDLSYAILENLVQKVLDEQPTFLKNKDHGIEAMSWNWLSMLELVQQMIGQNIEFQYGEKKYSFHPK